MAQGGMRGLPRDDHQEAFVRLPYCEPSTTLMRRLHPLRMPEYLQKNRSTGLRDQIQDRGETEVNFLDRALLLTRLGVDL